MSSTYFNPVYSHACPDPYVLKYCGEYWCYCTGVQPEGGCFGILHSPDLVHWRRVGSAMDPLPGNHPCYWAPEVTYRDGVFYLYYSVGDEEHMHLRVATARHPGGPFVDAGRQLTQEKFAIDAHVFEDEDGRAYLFYATDFLDVERVGTGTVVDRMLDPFTLACAPRPVTRARYDWQIYHPNRPEKGGLRWHTVEGPFVLKHDGRYYQMFSGGNWQNKTYGVSYAVTDSLETTGEWDQLCDGENVLPVLRSMPEAGVIGPGHNSVVRGPDNRQLFCVYHRWNPETSERAMAIDPLGWEGDRLVVYGPSTTPQPIPPQPVVAAFEQFVSTDGGWSTAGYEARLEPAAGAAAAPLAAAALARPLGRFTLEISLRGVESAPEGRFGLRLESGLGGELVVALQPGRNRAVLETPDGEHSRTLPEGFDPGAYHLLRIESTPGGIQVSLDGNRMRWEVPGPRRFDQIRLFAENESAVFAGFALTDGE